MQGDVRAAGQSVGTELEAGITRQLGALLAGGAAVSFLRDTVGAASDLNEAVSLTQNTFKAAADGVLDMGETSAESFGLAEDEALNFANSIGGLFIGFGETRGEAAAMAEDVVSLGADLASAKNLAGGTGEALEILRSGLVGEVEPLRRIGVALNAASVEQRALADTGKESAAQLTEGEKAAARYALIFESLNAQGVVGDFERTSQGAANQQRIFQAELRNTQAEVGQKLLPAFIDLIGAARDGLPLLTLVGDSLSTSAEGASLLAGAVGPLVGLVMDLNSGLGDLSGGALNFTNIADGLGQITAIVEAAKEVWGEGLSLGPITIGGGAEAASEAESTVQELIDASEILGIEATANLEDWASAVGSFSTQFGLSIAETLGELNIRGPMAGEIMHALTDGVADLGGAMGELLGQQQAVNDAASRTDLDDQAEALHAIADAADAARDQLEELFGIQQSVAEGAIDIRDRARDLLAQFVELGEGGYRSQTEAGDQFLSGLQEQQQAIIDQTLSIAATTGSYDTAREAQHRMETGLYDLARAAGVPDSELAELRATFGTLPRRTLLEVAQQGAQGVQGQIRTTKRMADEYAKTYQGNLTADAGQARSELSKILGDVAAKWTGKTFTANLALNSAGGAVANAAATVAGESAVAESARAPVTESFLAGPQVNVNVYPQALIGSVEEVAKVVTPAVAGAVEEMLRRG